MSLQGDLLGAFEGHSPDEIREVLAKGLDPREPIGGKRPVDSLVEMYTRSARFAECLRVMREAGAGLGDPMLEALLLDDDAALRGRVDLRRRFSMPGAYTSLTGVSALHVCAEYNSVRCARLLLEAGANVNTRAEVDADRLGGQTPLFHAVNSNRNYCRPVMEVLVEAGADLDVRLTGLVWGGGFAWETVVFDITPISYAQCGNYFQFHRREEWVASNVSYLFWKRYGREAPVRNVPNRYLNDARVFPPRS